MSSRCVWRYGTGSLCTRANTWCWDSRLLLPRCYGCAGSRGQGRRLRGTRLVGAEEDAQEDDRIQPGACRQRRDCQGYQLISNPGRRGRKGHYTNLRDTITVRWRCLFKLRTIELRRQGYEVRIVVVINLVRLFDRDVCCLR